MQPAYSVRPAQKSDCGDILRLISLLADFEMGKSDLTVETLEHDGFEMENPRFTVFVAEHEKDGVVGFALTFRNYSTWKGACVYLEDLYVEEVHRGRGVGTALLKHVVQYALDINSQRVDWVCIDFNTHAQEYYENYVGASKLSEWFHYRMEPNQMRVFVEKK